MGCVQLFIQSFIQDGKKVLDTEWLSGLEWHHCSTTGSDPAERLEITEPLPLQGHDPGAPMADDTLFSIPDAARLLGLPSKVAYRLVADGVLGPTVTGRRLPGRNGRQPAQMLRLAQIEAFASKRLAP
jgi:hypothetical protein